jgi:hypothetical protein
VHAVLCLLFGQGIAGAHLVFPNVLERAMKEPLPKKLESAVEAAPLS